MTIQLSICIPSYNRAKFLPDLLNSIVSQYDERVEIVISDNGSIDGTEALVRTWQQKYPRIVYERFTKNVGPDRCFMRSVELASGTFCWLMGDDDIIEQGGLERVLNALSDSLTGITVNRFAYDSSLQKKWIEPSITGLDKDTLFIDAKRCFSSIFVLFGFLSAQIIRKSAWISVIKQEDVSPYFNAYVLVYIMGRMIQKEPSWLYIDMPCVGWRSGNDSFAAELGRYRRFKLDVLGYDSILQGLFSKDKPFLKQMLTRVLQVHLLGHVRDLKFTSSGFVWQGLTLCLPRFYKLTAFWMSLFPLLCVPKSLLLFARKLKCLSRIFLLRQKEFFCYKSRSDKGVMCKEKEL